MVTPCVLTKGPRKSKRPVFHGAVHRLGIPRPDVRARELVSCPASISWTSSICWPNPDSLTNARNPRRSVTRGRSVAHRGPTIRATPIPPFGSWEALRSACCQSLASCSGSTSPPAPSPCWPSLSYCRCLRSPAWSGGNTGSSERTSCGGVRLPISPRPRSSATPAALAGTSPAASCSGPKRRSGSSISSRPCRRRSTPS
ncbi:hypothetical protein ACVIU4_006547 [Bradyrhizobium barranii subsp. barranii]